MPFLLTPLSVRKDVVELLAFVEPDSCPNILSRAAWYLASRSARDSFWREDELEDDDVDDMVDGEGRLRIRIWG